MSRVAALDPPSKLSTALPTGVEENPRHSVSGSASLRGNVTQHIIIERVVDHH